MLEIYFAHPFYYYWHPPPLFPRRYYMALLSQRIQSNSDLYDRLCRELDEGHSLSLTLEDTMARRQELTDRCSALETQVKVLSENSKKEYADLHKAKHFSMKSAAATLTGKKKALIKKEAAEYQQAFDNEQRAKRDLEQASMELSTLAQKETSLLQQIDHKKSIRRQLDSLVHEMFGEPSPDHPLEAQLRVEAQNYVDQLSLAKRDLGRFKEVDQTLVQALRQGRKLRDLIAVTLDYAPFDLFGGPMMDPQQMAYVEMCQRTTWDIQRRLNHVRQTLPEIPYPASLDVVTNNPLVSLRLDSNYVDVAWKMKTQQGFQRVAAGEKAVQAALHWVRQYLRYTEGAIERLKEASETTQTSLLQERRRIIDKILRQEPAVDGPLFDGDEADLPPPPLYEAPQNEEQTAPINPLIPLDIPTTMDNHLALPSPTSARNSMHIRTASQSSSIMDARPTQPPDRPAPPSPTATNASMATDGHDHNPFRHPPQ